MNTEKVLIDLGFKRYPQWDGEIFKSYRLETNSGIIFRAHPVYCNKPDYITAGIVSKKNTNNVECWLDFTNKDRLEKFIQNINLNEIVKNIKYKISYG